MSKLLDLLGGSIVKDIGNVIDDLHTSTEEKDAAKQKMQELLQQAEANAQAEVSARWASDMKYGTWLAKNIRPLTLIFLTVVFVLLSFFDGNLGNFTINDAYKPIYQTLLITVYGAYFAGRSVEKIKKSA
jgi:hypothetical protein|tara:strand:+ start:535 stop:924 length:390 start_codon:yes stop_codon:yes gene_type:complete